MNLLNVRRDPTYGTLYLRFREGATGYGDPDQLPEGLVEDSLELDEGVYLDVDERGQVIGIEFETLTSFEEFLKRHPEGVDIPDRVEDATSFHLDPA